MIFFYAKLGGGLRLTQQIISIFLLTVSMTGNSFSSEYKEREVHLFILSGQSNMAELNINESFLPAVQSRFGDDVVLVVKDAHHGQGIERWYKTDSGYFHYMWNLINGRALESRGELYLQLMTKVKVKIDGYKLASITFVWMQGERDALTEKGYQYKDSWHGLVKNLKDDFATEEISFVIGRLSDFDLKNEKYPHWSVMRNIQVSLANADINSLWVDTDGYNGNNNDLHYTKEGYKRLGASFARKAIELIEKRNSLIFKEAIKN